MDPIQKQSEGSIGDRLVASLNSVDSPRLVFHSQAEKGEAPDLIHREGDTELAAEVASAY